MGASDTIRARFEPALSLSARRTVVDVLTDPRQCHRMHSRTNLGIDGFVWFIHERDRIHVARHFGEPRPWTDDPVLHSTRITNIDRENDAGTRLLRQTTSGLETRDIVFYSTVFRSAYSSNPFIQWLSGNRDHDLERIQNDPLPNLGRKSYQVFLHNGQTIRDFLLECSIPIADSVAACLPLMSGTSILTAAETIATMFKSRHGKRMIFLASEIAKDLSVAYPDRIDPQSMCPMNTGARKALSRLYPGETEGWKVNQLLKVTGLTPSVLEHALCEWNKYCERWSFYQEHGRFKPAWLYTPSGEVEE